MNKISRRTVFGRGRSGGQRLAIGLNTTKAWKIYKTSNLQFRFNADIKGFENGDLSKVTWSSDGAHLIAGGV